MHPDVICMEIGIHCNSLVVDHDRIQNTIVCHFLDILGSSKLNGMGSESKIFIFSCLIGDEA